MNWLAPKPKRQPPRSSPVPLDAGTSATHIRTFSTMSNREKIYVLRSQTSSRIQRRRRKPGIRRFRRLAGRAMWRAAGHMSELSTAVKYQRSQPTQGRSRQNLRIQTPAAEQTADKLHSRWSRAVFWECHGSDGTMELAHHCRDRAHEPLYGNNTLCRNEFRSSLHLSSHRRNEQTIHQHVCSVCRLTSAMRNHMSRGQRMSQQARQAEIVGPSRACSFLKAKELSGRPVADEHYVKDTIGVKKIAEDSSKTILDFNYFLP